jgi:hypothetical protein
VRIIHPENTLPLHMNALKNSFFLFLLALSFIESSARQPSSATSLAGTQGYPLSDPHNRLMQTGSQVKTWLFKSKKAGNP